MLESLQFVQGAVAAKSHVPSLQFLDIVGQRVFACNGMLTMSAPLECDLAVQPQADLFIRAVQLCEGPIALQITGTGRLMVKSETFKAFVPTTKEPLPTTMPKGEPMQTDNLLGVLQTLAPFMSTDDARPWFCGILFAHKSAYATNNIILVEHWLKYPVERPFGLPAATVRELLRIGEEPESLQATANTVTFHFTGDRWLTSSLLMINRWPDVRNLLHMPDELQLSSLNSTFFDALQSLHPFTKAKNRIWLHDNLLATEPSLEDGAQLTLDTVHGMAGAWSVDHLSKLHEVATSIAWDCYPKPCPFFGDSVRGVIAGLKPNA